MATRAALDYLEELHSEFKDWQLALAAYNCGENCVRRAIYRNKKKGRPIKYKNLRLPRETRRYVPKLQAVKNIIDDPQKFNYQLRPIPNTVYLSKVPLQKEIDIVLAANLAKLTISEFLLLNPSYNRPILIPEAHRPLLLPSHATSSFIEGLENLSEPRVTWQIYKLRKKEAVKSLSKRFSIASSKLLKINGLYPSSSLAKGTMILTPIVDSTKSTNIGELWDHKFFTESTSIKRTKLVHRIRRGDNLSKIARRYNVSIKSIKRWNGIKGSIIRKGQRLVIYGNPSFHKVVSGDTLSGISRRYGVPIKKLKQWNGLQGNLIRIGQKLLLYKRFKTPRLSDLLT